MALNQSREGVSLVDVGSGPWKRRVGERQSYDMRFLESSQSEDGKQSQARGLHQIRGKGKPTDLRGIEGPETAFEVNRRPALAAGPQEPAKERRGWYNTSLEA